MTKPIKIACIPDTQVKPDQDLSYLRAIGNYIVEKQPDAVVHLGDFADMPSLSSYDKGRKSFEGRRYKHDIEAAKEGMRILLDPLYTYNDTHTRNKKRKYQPYMLMLLGNHDGARITRAIEDDPKLDGTIGISDLGYESFGWEVSPFLKVEQVAGICFSHYFVSGVMGRPITSAQALLTKKHVSCIAGHQQGKQIATATRGDGKRITGIITGSCLAPEHKVLTADLRYVPLGDIKVGDKLVSFDEHLGMSAKRSRRYKTGTVRAVRRNTGELFEVTLENGKKFRATADHLWLTKNCMGVTRWQRTKDLTYTKYHVNQNTKVSRVLPEWETANTRTAGWLAGMYDGEGSLHARSTTGGACASLQISQSPEKNLSTCVRLIEAHKEFGFDLGEDASRTRTCKSWRIKGGRAEVARLLGMIRPQRLLDKFSPELLGTLTTKYEEPLSSIMDVRSIGHGEYVEIDIDAATMIVEGYPHHNCYPGQEEYLGPQGNEHWRGMLMCYEAIEGQFDEGFISLDYLRSKYG